MQTRDVKNKSAQPRKSYRKPQLQNWGPVNMVTAGAVTPYFVNDEVNNYYYSPV